MGYGGAGLDAAAAYPSVKLNVPAPASYVRTYVLACTVLLLLLMPPLSSTAGVPPGAGNGNAEDQYSSGVGFTCTSAPATREAHSAGAAQKLCGAQPGCPRCHPCMRASAQFPC